MVVNKSMTGVLESDEVINLSNSDGLTSRGWQKDS